MDDNNQPAAPDANVRAVTEADMRFGAAVRARRIGLGMTQAALAEKVGITFQQLQKYESGRNRVSAGRIVGLAAALETTPAQLFDAVGAEVVSLMVPAAQRIAARLSALPTQKRSDVLVSFARLLDAIEETAAAETGRREAVA